MIYTAFPGWPYSRGAVFGGAMLVLVSPVLDTLHHKSQIDLRNNLIAVKMNSTFHQICGCENSRYEIPPYGSWPSGT